MPRKWSQAHRNHIIELYLSGMTQRQVANAVGSDQKQIGRVLRQAGASRDGKTASLLSWELGRVPYQLRTDLDVDGIVERYLAGETCKAIGRDVGVDAGVIKRRLVERGIRIRGVTETNLLLDREKQATVMAEGRSRKTGFGEDILYQMLVDRGEVPDRQFPVGTKNIDLAFPSVAVEVWFSGNSPFNDPYCLERVKYLAEREWITLYVWIAKRTRVLLGPAADKVVSCLKLSRRNPSALRKHRVIRGCGELAAIASFDMNHVTHIPPSKDCPHHSCVNKSVRR